MRAVSVENRFDAAYKALMQTARAVLLAHGYRPSTSVPGHHQVVIQVLPTTLGISADRVAVLDALRKQRNIADYTGEGISDESLQSCFEEAKRLRAEVEAWFKKNKPELRKP